MDEFCGKTCRTCLEINANSLQLQNQMENGKSNKTYKDFLKQLAQIEFLDEQEFHMPQNICTVCCNQLQNAYDFIKKAQQANDELIKMIPKPLDCLLEQTIDIPVEEIDNLLDIKQENANFLTDMTQEINRDAELDGIKMEVETLLQIELCMNAADVDKSKISTNKKQSDEENNDADVDYHDDENANHDDENADHDDENAIQEFENIKSPQSSTPTAEHKDEISKTKSAEKPSNESKSNKRKCQQCDYTANTYAALDYHLRAKHGSDDDKFKCTFCEYYTCKKCNLLAHIRKMHKAKIKEIRKEREAPTENSSDIFSDDPYEEDEIIRDLINMPKKGTAKPVNESEKRQKTEVKESIYECRKCPSKYNKRSKLKDHMQDEHDNDDNNDDDAEEEEIKPKKCRLCDYEGNSYSALNYHNRSKHGTEDDKIKCNFCQYSSFKKYDLLLHMTKNHKADIKELRKEKEGTEMDDNDFSGDEEFIRDLIHLGKKPTTSKSAKSAKAKLLLKQKLKMKMEKEMLEAAGNAEGKVEKKKKKKPPPQPCKFCTYVANTSAAMHYHLRSKHGDDDSQFKCQFCVNSYLKKFDLLTHIKNYHKQAVKDLKKDMNFKSEESAFKSLPKSIKRNSATESSNSDDDDDDEDDTPLIALKHGIESNAETDDEDEFIRHLLNMQKRTPKSKVISSLPRSCDICGNVYKDASALYTHKRFVHANEDDYHLCTFCGKKYKRRYDLKLHQQNKHSTTPRPKLPPPQRDRRFLCTYCSYCCTTITILKIHINRHHTGERPYKCEICNKTFVVPYDLKTHRYIHTGERPYKCPYCLKGFRDSSKLMKHKRIHTNERPYKCTQCEKTFTQSYNLTLHKRTHYKALNLTCNVCGKIFGDSALLNLHRINEEHIDEVQ